MMLCCQENISFMLLAIEFQWVFALTKGGKPFTIQYCSEFKIEQLQLDLQLNIHFCFQDDKLLESLFLDTK